MMVSVSSTFGLPIKSVLQSYWCPAGIIICSVVVW
jgi:hypothetical protein